MSQYLARLAAEATTVINAGDYGQTIYDLAIRRALILIGEDVVNIAFDAPVDMAPADQIEDAERRLYELAETGRYDGGFARFSDALKDAIDMASAAFQRDGHLSGLATGLDDLDRMMGGLQPSDLVILAGRPGMGKTSLATNIAFHVAKHYRYEMQPDGAHKTVDGGSVGFFSLEMSAEQLATRVIAEQASVPSYKIRRGDLTEEEFTRLVVASQEMQAIPLYIDDTGGISIAQLVARARRLKRQRGLDLIVVDYIQLIQGSSKKSSENRVQEITEITTGLKALAKELGVPIIGLSQLSRQVENRDDKRPQLSDLRESGLDRARRRRRDVRVPRGILRQEQEAQGRHRRILQVAGRDGSHRGQGRDHHRQAAPRTDRHGRSSVRRRRDALWKSGAGRSPARADVRPACPAPTLMREETAGRAPDDRRRGHRANWRLLRDLDPAVRNARRP